MRSAWGGAWLTEGSAEDAAKQVSITSNGLHMMQLYARRCCCSVGGFLVGGGDRA